MAPLALGQPAAACRGSHVSVLCSGHIHSSIRHSSMYRSGCARPAQLPHHPLQPSVMDKRAGRYSRCPRRSTVRRYRDGAKEAGPAAPKPTDAAGAAATPGLVPVRFRLVRRVSWGEGVALVGGSWALGDWDPAQGLRMTWGEGDVWSATAALPPGRTIHFKYVITRADSGALVAWGEDLRGGAGGNLQLRVTPQAGDPEGYTLEVLPTPTPGAYPSLSVEVDTAALQAQQQQQQQDPGAEEDKVNAAPPPPAAAGDDSTSSAVSPSRPSGALDLPQDAAAAVASLESLADDEMQLLRSLPGSPEGSWDDSPVASAESPSGGSADTAAAGLDAGDDTIGLHTASGSSETPSPAPSADTNTYQQQQQQQPRGPPAAGVGDDDDDDTQADVLASGTSAKQGVDLNRAAPPDPALLAPEAAGDDAGGDEDTLTPRGVTSSGLASRAAAAGVTSSSDEDVLDPEVVALVNALWDSTPTPCDPEVDFQLTGEEGLAAWNTSLDDANEELRAAAAARLSSMDGGDPSRLLNNTPNSSSGDSKNSAGGPDLGAQPGLAGDVSPMPADVEVAEAAPGVELRHPGDTPRVTGDTTTGDTAVPEQDGFTAAAAAAVEARLSRQQQEAEVEQPQGGTAAPAARGTVGDRTGDTADRVPDGGDPAIASQASSAAAGGTLQAPDAAQDALLTLAVLAAAMGRLNQPGSPSAAPSGDTPAAPAAAAGDTSSGPGDTIPTPHVSILSASSLDGGAEVAAGAAAAAAAGVPSSFVVASADPEELWGSRDEVVLPPGFYQGVVGGSVDGWAADKYPNITGAATAAAAATGGGAAGGGGDVGEEAAIVYDTIDMTSMVYTIDDGDAGSSTPDVTSGAGGEEAAEGVAEQQGSGLAPADGSKPEQSGATPAAAATNARKLVAVEGPDLITLDLDARLGEGVVAGAVTDVSPDTLEPLDPIITDEVTLPGLVPGCSGLDAESAAAAGNDTTISAGASSGGGVGGDSSLAGEAPSDAEGATDDMEEVLRAAMRRRAAWGMGEAETAARVEQPELVLVSAEEEGGEGSPPGDEAASDGGEGVQRAGDQGLQGEAAAEEDASSP